MEKINASDYPLLLLETYIIPNSQRGKYMGIFQCHCGKIFHSVKSRVYTGRTKSCGCSRIEKFTKKTHGMSNHPIYKIWTSMKQRCINPKNHKYYMYGGRGIIVCERWLNFENFKQDMFLSYKKGLSIDRINNNGNYEPDNCHWQHPKNKVII